MDLISVIIPVYNTAPYLSQCIDSILAQEAVNLDIILVNDDSDDGSEVICHEYADRYPDIVRVIDCKRQGLSLSRNRGITEAKGQYLCFVDSDDMLFPGALNYLLGILNENSSDIATGIMSRSIKVKQSPYNVKVLSNSETLKDILYQKGNIDSSCCAKLYRKSIFDRCCEWFVAGRKYEDLEAFPRFLMNSNKITVSNYIVYFYRQRSNSIINTWTPNRKDVLWVTERVGEYVAEVAPDAHKAADSRRFSAVFNMFVLGTIHGDTQLTKECWIEIVRLRRQMLTDPHVRLRNKIGAVISFLGKSITGVIAHGIGEI